MNYKDIFSPKTLAKLNRASAEHLRQMLGNKTMMQALVSSQKVLSEIQTAEAPYKVRLEALAIEMVKELYPIIDEQGIKIDAKISAGSNVNDTLDEITVNKPNAPIEGKKYDVKVWYAGDNWDAPFIRKIYEPTDGTKGGEEGLYWSKDWTYGYKFPDGAIGFYDPQDGSVLEYNPENKIRLSKELDEITVNSPIKYHYPLKISNQEQFDSFLNYISNEYKKKYPNDEIPNWALRTSLKFPFYVHTPKGKGHIEGFFYPNYKRIEGSNWSNLIKDIKVLPKDKKDELRTILKDKFNISENITPEARRRIINAVTQGAALRGAFAFYLFKEHLDEIDPTLIEKYNQIMKEVFGIYDDDNAIALMLSALAQGHKQAGGSSKVIINEITVARPGDDYEIFFYEDSYLFNGKKVKGSLDTVKKIAEKELEKARIWRKGNYWALIIKKDLENPNLDKEIGRVKMGKDGWEHYSLTNEITIANPTNKIFTFKDDPNYGIRAGKYKVVGEDEDEYKLVDVKNGHIEFVSKYYAENNQTTQPLREAKSSSGITIQARAICFPMLVHEIIKGLYELISLQGFKGADKKANQAVVDKVDLLKNEPEDIKYGKFIYDALNGIFADSNYEDPRIREFFFTEIYRLGEKEFIAFIENAINEELSPQQQSWVKMTLRDIADDLKADDRDALDEITVNNPNTKDQDIADLYNDIYYEINELYDDENQNEILELDGELSRILQKAELDPNIVLDHMEIEVLTDLKQSEKNTLYKDLKVFQEKHKLINEITVAKPIPKFKNNQDMETYLEANDDVRAEFLKKALSNTEWDKTVEEWLDYLIEKHAYMSTDIDEPLYINDGDDNVIHFTLNEWKESTRDKQYKIQLGPNIINVIYT